MSEKVEFMYDVHFSVLGPNNKTYHSNKKMRFSVPLQKGQEIVLPLRLNEVDVGNVTCIGSKPAHDSYASLSYAIVTDKVTSEREFKRKTTNLTDILKQNDFS